MRLVQRGAIATMRSPPTPIPKHLALKEDPSKAEIRLTIPVSVEVHEAFSRIAATTRMPVGRAMGEWLADTLDAALFMAQTLEKARSAPKLVAQELHAYALGIGDETKGLLDTLRAKGRAADGSAAGGSPRPAPGPTPPSNTGVTTNKNKSSKGGTGGKNPR